MKQLFTFVASILLMTGICQAQDSLHNTSPGVPIEKKQYTIPQKDSKEYFLEKGSKLNRTGWVLLSVGSVLGVTGTIIYVNSIHSKGGWDQLGNEYGGAFLILAGSSLVLTSIPVFIRSGYYKRKALNMSASFKLEPYQSGLSVKHFPSVGVSIRL